MGLFDWIFRKQVKNREELVDPGVTLTFRAERVKTQEACDSFSHIIAGVPVRAEVPIEKEGDVHKIIN